jgi:hypothetical protein
VVKEKFFLESPTWEEHLLRQILTLQSLKHYGWWGCEKSELPLEEELWN